jgi:hypothetical protein
MKNNKYFTNLGWRVFNVGVYSITLLLVHKHFGILGSCLFAIFVILLSNYPIWFTEEFKISIIKKIIYLKLWLTGKL